MWHPQFHLRATHFFGCAAHNPSFLQVLNPFGFMKEKFTEDYQVQARGRDGFADNGESNICHWQVSLGSFVCGTSRIIEWQSNSYTRELTWAWHIYIPIQQHILQKEYFNSLWRRPFAPIITYVRCATQRTRSSTFISIVRNTYMHFA